jgi:hypothetical protein
MKIHVLQNRKTGKSASREDAQELANQMRAIELQKTGMAAGIAALLVPEAMKNAKTIKKASRTHRLIRVIPRRSRVTIKARNSLACPEVRTGILHLYLKYVEATATANPSFRSPRTLKLMWTWLESSLTNRGSPLFVYLSKKAPEIILDSNRCPRAKARGKRWWAAEFAKYAI